MIQPRDQVAVLEANSGEAAVASRWATRGEETLTPDREETSSYFAHKLLVMRVLAAVLLVVLSPLILACMLIVRLTSRGPAIYRQTRVGKDGRLFEILKIRTMTSDAENESGAVLCRPGDARITGVGRVYRFLHLDELPQLVNVVRGEMCLVGPRPERPEIIEKNRLNEVVPGFEDRTRVLPGVTGLAQVNLPPDLSADCVIPKVRLDLNYIETATASLDFRILLCTALRLVGVRQSRAIRWLGICRKSYLDSQDLAPAMESTETNGKPVAVAARRMTPVHAAASGEPHVASEAHRASDMTNGDSSRHAEPVEAGETRPRRPR